MNLPGYASLILLAVSVRAQTNNPTPRPDPVKLRAEFITNWKPFRVIGETLYDFTPWFSARQSDQWETMEQFRNKVRFKAKVIQVVNDGLLVQIEESTTIVHVRNYSAQERVIDGSRISFLSMPCGRYQYLNTQGAQTTILDLDCGHFYDLNNHRFKEKTLVFASEQKDMPIPDLDLKAFEYIQKLTNASGPTILIPLVVDTNKPAAAPSTAPTSSSFEYSIVSGDTLNEIAEKFHVSVKAIRDANPHLVPERMKVGQRIRIPHRNVP